MPPTWLTRPGCRNCDNIVGLKCLEVSGPQHTCRITEYMPDSDNRSPGIKNGTRLTWPTRARSGVAVFDKRLTLGMSVCKWWDTICGRIFSFNLTAGTSSITVLPGVTSCSDFFRCTKPVFAPDDGSAGSKRSPGSRDASFSPGELQTGQHHSRETPVPRSRTSQDQARRLLAMEDD